MHFGCKPLLGAMKHLINGRNHNNVPKNGAFAIQNLGIRVLHCDAQKADMKTSCSIRPMLPDIDRSE